MPSLFSRLRQYTFSAPDIPIREKARSVLGAMIGIAIAAGLAYLLIDADSGLPLIAAPLGASAVILFALPASPLAQPWPVFGGNVISALIGIACGQFINEPLFAGAIAVGVAITAMFLLRCLHPPGGAVALLTALGGPEIMNSGFAFALAPIALDSFVMIVVAIGYNRLCGRRYPNTAEQNLAPHRPQPSVGVTPEDLDAVLRQHTELLDITRDDLEQIVEQTEMHAYHRHFGNITCADIMTKDLVTVEFGTEIHEAWALLRDHQLQALPVVNRFNRLIGMINQHDMLMAADREARGSRGGFWNGVQRLMQRTPGMRSDKAEVVGQIMATQPDTAFDDQPIAELIPFIVDAGVHQIPILDHNQRLVGLVAQADMVAALYQTALEGMGVMLRKRA